MKNDLVSVGIPMYNAEKFIELTIKSILNQSYQNFEIIITDDGSTDKSIEIINSLNDPRIKLISDGSNKGISYRLNQQVSLAKGKYFARMDADDIMFPNRLERQVQYLNNHQDVDAVGSSVVVLDDDSQIIAFRPALLLTEYKQLFNHIFFNHPTVTGKLQFFKQYPYSDEFIGVEDSDLWLRSFHTSKFHVMEEPVLFYRDPLVFKVNTYKFRLNQKIKLLRKNEYLREHPFLKQKLILENTIKKIVATILNFIKKDEILISRRNNTSLPIKEEWREVLNNAIDAK